MHTFTTAHLHHITHHPPPHRHITPSPQHSTASSKHTLTTPHPHKLTASSLTTSGVCCWEILMRGVKPFVGIKNDEVISKIELGERLPLPAECPALLFGLMNRCWSYDPEERPDFATIQRLIRWAHLGTLWSTLEDCVCAVRVNLPAATNTTFNIV